LAEEARMLRLVLLLLATAKVKHDMAVSIGRKGL
jgi:hypothetical protein